MLILGKSSPQGLGDAATDNITPLEGRVRQWRVGGCH